MAPDLKDPWHFPRPELAKRYLQLFDTGLVSAQALFAPRRMGKSEFLEMDLIPAALGAGYRTAYLNMWDERKHPRRALFQAVSRASPGGIKSFVKRFKALKKVKASAKVSSFAEGAVEAEFLDDEKRGALALSELLRSFDRADRKLLLVLDEAQVLAAAAHADLAHSLRAGLDVRKATIKVVFAGSSENSLRSMFGRPTQPFYNWAPIDPFERLGDEFVVAMTLKVNDLSRYPLSEKDAQRAFEKLKKTPEFFRRYLQRYLTYANLGAQAALDYTAARVFDNSSYRASWARLKAADRAVLRALAQGLIDLHSLPARAQLGDALGLGKAVTLDTPRHALGRLQKEELIVKIAHGHYRIEDDAFAEWLRERDLEE